MSNEVLFNVFIFAVNGFYDFSFTLLFYTNQNLDQ